MDRAWMRFYSDRMAGRIEHFNGSAYEQLRKTAELIPNAPALRYFGFVMSFGELLSEIIRVSEALVSLGFTKGDVIVISHPNSILVPVLLYSANRIGVICSFVDSGLSVQALHNAAVDNSCKGILINDSKASNISEIVEGTDIKLVIIGSLGDYLGFVTRLYIKARRLFDEDVESVRTIVPAIDGVEILDWNGLRNKEGNSTSFKGSPNDIALRFNRGTAAGEYAIESFTNSALISAVENTRIAFGFPEISDKASFGGTSVMSGIETSYSGMISISIHSMLCLGNCFIFIPVYKVGDFSKAVFKFMPNTIIAYPNMFMELLENVRNSDRYTRKDMSFLDHVISVGAGFPTVKRQEFNRFMDEHNCGAEVQELYGLTECLSVCSVNPQFHAKGNSIGIPFPEVLMKIIDSKTMSELAPGQKGEICVYTPTALKEVLNDPESTSKILRKHRDGRLWVHTGDIGHMDEDGFFYFDYNQKRLVNIEGVSVSLKAVEDVIKNVYGVSDVCAVDYSDEEGTSRLIAVVVPTDRYLFDNDKLSELKAGINLECEMVLGEKMRPYDVEYRASLPKVGLGVTDYKTVMQEVTEARLDKKS